MPGRSTRHTAGTEEKTDDLERHVHFDSTAELSQVGGGTTLHHELWQLNNALTTTVQQQQSSGSNDSQMMMAMCMAVMARR